VKVADKSTTLELREPGGLCVVALFLVVDEMSLATRLTCIFKRLSYQSKFWRTSASFRGSTHTFPATFVMFPSRTDRSVGMDCHLVAWLPVRITR
jgi:hypothetical protein